MLKGKLKYVQGLYLSSKNKYDFSYNKKSMWRKRRLQKLIKT